MALSTTTKNRAVWGVRILLVVPGSPVPAIVLGSLCALVVHHLRPAAFRNA